MQHTLLTLPFITMLVFGPSVAEWVYDKTGGVVGPHTAGLGWEKDGILTNGFAIEGWNGHNLFASQRHEKPAPRSLWYSFTDYCFNKLGCSRITALVPADNEKAIKLNTKIGMVEEGRLRQAADNGEDLIAMVLWKKDCRMLEWNKNG